MRSTLASVVAGGGMLLGLGLTLETRPAAAQAPPYGCGCLHNNTQHTVKFRYKWGDGEWKNDYLRSGNQQTLCWRYEQGSTVSPTLAFQLDVDLTAGSAWTTFNLPRVQSRTNSCEAVSRQYHYDISYRPNTNRQFLQMTHRQ